jgi:hypothetical protein
LLLSSDSLPPINSVPDWLRGFTFHGNEFPGTDTQDGYTDLQYDSDDNLISGYWEGYDPMYIIGPYFDPNAAAEYHGFHGKGYSDLRLDQTTLGDIVDENGVATFTLTFEYDSFYFEVEEMVDETGKKVRKIVFKLREDQKAWFINPYSNEDERRDTHK